MFKTPPLDQKSLLEYIDSPSKMLLRRTFVPFSLLLGTAQRQKKFTSTQSLCQVDQFLKMYFQCIFTFDVMIVYPLNT